MEQITYTIERTLAELHSYQNTKKLLTLTSWNGRDPKLDLRTWERRDDGKLSPRKGITLSEQEGKQVGKALFDYFRAKQEGGVNHG